MRTCKIDGFATGVVSDPRYVADAGGPDGSRIYPFGGLHGLLLITAVVSTSVKTALSLAAAKSSDGLLHYTGRNPDGSTADYTLLIREDTTTYEVFAQPPANPVTGIHSRSITRAEVAAAADILGLSVLSAEPIVLQSSLLPPAADGSKLPTSAPRGVATASFKVITLGNGVSSSGSPSSSRSGPLSSQGGLGWARGALFAPPSGPAPATGTGAQTTGPAVVASPDRGPTPGLVVFKRVSQNAGPNLSALHAFPQAIDQATLDAAVRAKAEASAREAADLARLAQEAALALEAQAAEVARTQYNWTLPKPADRPGESVEAEADTAMPLAEGSAPSVLTIGHLLGSGVLSRANIFLPTAPSDKITLDGLQEAVYSRADAGDVIASAQLLELLLIKAEWGRRCAALAASQQAMKGLTARGPKGAPQLSSADQAQLSALTVAVKADSEACSLLKAHVAILAAEALGDDALAAPAKGDIIARVLRSLAGEGKFSPLHKAARSQILHLSTATWLGFCMDGTQALTEATVRVLGGLEQAASALAARKAASLKAEAERADAAAAKVKAAAEEAALTATAPASATAAPAAAPQAPLPSPPSATPPPAGKGVSSAVKILEARASSLKEASRLSSVAARAAHTAQQEAEAALKTAAAAAAAATSLQQSAVALGESVGAGPITHEAASAWAKVALAHLAHSFHKGSPGYKDPLAATPGSTAGNLFEVFSALHATNKLNPLTGQLIAAHLEAADAKAEAADAHCRLATLQKDLERARELASKAAGLAAAANQARPQSVTAADEAATAAARLPVAAVQHDIHQATEDAKTASANLAPMRFLLPYLYAVSSDPPSSGPPLNNPAATKVVLEATAASISAAIEEQEKLIPPGPHSERLRTELSRARSDIFTSSARSLYDITPDKMVPLLRAGGDELIARVQRCVGVVFHAAAAAALAPRHPRDSQALGAENDDEQPEFKKGRTGVVSTMDAAPSASAVTPSGAASHPL